LENEVVQVWKSLENDSQISVRTLDRTIKLDSVMCHCSSCRRCTKSAVDYDSDYD